MKKISTLCAILILTFVTKSFGQYIQNFDASNSLTSGCSIVANTDRTTTTGEVINGSGSLFSNPPVNGSGTRDYATPYLNIVSNSFTVSFNYKLNENLNGQATRTIEIGLLDKNGVYTSLNTILMDKDNDPTVSTPYSQTFTAATGAKRLVIKMAGAQGNGGVRIIMDDLVASANPYYTLSGTCNTAPSIQNDLYTTIGVAVYNGSTVLANDTDPNGETLSAPIIATQSPDGNVVLNADGTFTFTPKAGFKGTSTSFTYTVSDNGYDVASGTATVTINFSSGITLPVRFVNFQGSLVNNKVQLNWLVDDNNTGDRFEIQKSNNGKNFSVRSVVFTTNKNGTESYIYTETSSLEGGAYYRIKVINKDYSTFYTNVVFLKNNSGNTTEKITLLKNNLPSSLSFSLNSTNTEAAKVNLYNAAGVKVYSSDIKIQKGINTIAQDTYINLAHGMYILEVASTTKRIAVKLTK